MPSAWQKIFLMQTCHTPILVADVVETLRKEIVDIFNMPIAIGATLRSQASASFMQKASLKTKPS